MGNTTEEELVEEVGVIQELRTHQNFYVIDAKVKELARGLGLTEMGIKRDVDDLNGGQRTKVLLAKLLLQKPDIPHLDEPTNYLYEPTNHLDVDAKEECKRALIAYRVDSHDFA